MAYARRDYTFCAEWVYSDYCYEGIAALTGNPTICNLISYEGYRKECKAVLTKDVTWCRGSDTEDCYQLLALLTGDEEVCERLWVEATDRVKEVRDLDLEVAKCIKMAAKDVTDCVQKSGTGVDCDAIPAVVGDASLCEKLRANTDACYFRTALRAAGVPLESLLL